MSALRDCAAPIVVETPAGEPLVLDGGRMTSVSVRDVVAWAFANRPDIVSDARLASLPRKDCCPPGFIVHTCPACGGRGFTPEDPS